MQLAIELPEELGKELLQQVNVNEFVQEAIKKMLSEQKKIRESLIFSDNQNIIKLTKEEQENFVNSLLNPKPPNEKLKRSALAYKKRMGL